MKFKMRTPSFKNQLKRELLERQKELLKSADSEIWKEGYGID